MAWGKATPPVEPAAGSRMPLAFAVVTIVGGAAGACLSVWAALVLVAGFPGGLAICDALDWKGIVCAFPALIAASLAGWLLMRRGPSHDVGVALLATGMVLGTYLLSGGL